MQRPRRTRKPYCCRLAGEKHTTERSERSSGSPRCVMRLIFRMRRIGVNRTVRNFRRSRSPLRRSRRMPIPRHSGGLAAWSQSSSRRSRFSDPPNWTLAHERSRRPRRGRQRSRKAGVPRRLTAPRSLPSIDYRREERRTQKSGRQAIAFAVALPHLAQVLGCLRNHVEALSR